MDKLTKIHISPNFTLDKSKMKVIPNDGGNSSQFDFDDSEIPTIIYKDRMEGWFFLPAEILLKDGHDIAAIHMVTPLIEALEERYMGKSSNGKSGAFFTNRAKKIFPNLDTKGLEILYGGVRCGFAHHGFLKNNGKRYNILIRRSLVMPIEYTDSVLWIDPEKYCHAIMTAFGELFAEISTNTYLQESLRMFWEKDWQMSVEVPGGCGKVVDV